MIKRRVLRNLTAGILGLTFGIGLSVSQMTDSMKVLNFLDVSSTKWDPSMLVVMATALIVAVPLFQLGLRRRRRPLLGTQFSLPQKTKIEPRLVVGASIFGVGWGITGLCPGPGLVALSGGYIRAAAYVGAMLLGMTFYSVLSAYTTSATNYKLIKKDQAATDG